jgi:morphogenetic protein associated with SpoVID
MPYHLGEEQAEDWYQQPTALQQPFMQPSMPTQPIGTSFPMEPSAGSPYSPMMQPYGQSQPSSQPYFQPSSQPYSQPSPSGMPQPVTQPSMFQPFPYSPMMPYGAQPMPYSPCLPMMPYGPQPMLYSPYSPMNPYFIAPYREDEDEN